MFKKIKIENFRGINSLIIQPINKINVFVGDNMVGKTAILDSIFIAINPNDPLLPFRTNKFRNIDYPINTSQVLSFFNYNKTEKNILISLENDVRKRVIKISPKFKISGKSNFDKLLNETEIKENKSEISSTTENKYNIAGIEENFIVNGNKYKSTVEIVGPNLIEAKGDPNFKQDIKGRYLNSATFNNKNLIEIYIIVLS